MEHAKNIFKEIASKNDNYYDIKEELRSLNSCEEITDKEYDYILEEWDNLLKEFGL